MSALLIPDDELSRGAASAAGESPDGRAFATMRHDLRRFFALDGSGEDPGLFEKLRILVDTPGLHAVLVYRFGSWIHRSIRFRPLRYPLKLAYYVLQKMCVILWGIFIDVRARIGPGLYIGHFGGVIIGPIEMGQDCNVGHQVTIGRRADGVPGLPVIGSRVWIGMGSVLFGSIRIGDGVTIAPCTVVGRSVPARFAVSGNPMRVLRKNYDNSAEIYGSPPAPSDPSAPPADDETEGPDASPQSGIS
jgi:serine O-acetyltransferase